MLYFIIKTNIFLAYLGTLLEIETEKRSQPLDNLARQLRAKIRTRPINIKGSLHTYIHTKKQQQDAQMGIKVVHERLGSAMSN